MPKKKSKKYHVTVELNGKTFPADGDTVLEALNSIQFEQPETVVLLVATHEGNRSEVLLNASRFRTFLGEESMRAVVADRLQSVIC